MATIKYIPRGWKYELTEDYAHPRRPISGFEAVTGSITRDDGLVLVSITRGALEVFSGYAWDGPSGPTRDSKNSMRGSLVHDVLYQLTRVVVEPTSDAQWDAYQLAADREFKRILDEDGMSWYRRNLWYRAVRAFGGSHIRGEEEEGEQTAP